MAQRMALAVLHCTKKQPEKVINLGNRLLDGLYVKILLFPDPPIAKADFKILLKAASESQTEADGGGIKDTGQRDQDVLALFEVIKELRDYVNRLYKGNKVNILDSGFDANTEPSPHSLPDVPIIKEIRIGPLPHSVKIILSKKRNSQILRHESLDYIVQMAIDPGMDENFDTVLITRNQYHLIIDKLTRGKEIFIRIATKNSRGQSDWSNVTSFVSQ
jgi:hypothetical protein